MARKRQIIVPLPVQGLDQSRPLSEQKAGTTPRALNCWPIDSVEGRARLGIRPGKISIGSTGAGTVYHAIPINYTTGSGGSAATTEGIAVCGANGTFISSDGSSFSEHITQGVGSLTWPDQASCAVFGGVLYQADASAQYVRYHGLATGSEASLSGVSAPERCGIVVAHGNRLWLMGDKVNPHVYYASKLGDAADWDYTKVTSAGAFASTGVDGGQIGEPIVAAISQSSHCLLIGSTTSVYAVLGNPRGGSIRRISDHVGPLGNTAWCNDAEGNTWMVTKRGLYRITPNGGAVIPESEQIPNELIGYSPSTGDRIAIGYDHRWPGVHVFVDASTNKSFFKSFQTGGIFEQSFSSIPRACVSFPKIQTGNNSSLVMVDDSAAYQFKRDLEGADSSESRNSYIWIPIPLSDAHSEGQLHAITAALSEVESPVLNRCDWEIYVGKSAEQAINSTAAFTGARWQYADAAGTEAARYIQPWQYPKSRGNYAYLKVVDVSNNRWLIEQIIAEITPAGRRRI